MNDEVQVLTRWVDPTIEQLQQENQTNKRIIEIQVKRIYELECIIEELKKWLEEQKQFIENIPTFTKDIKNNHIGMIGAYENTLDKIKEFEEGVKTE